MCTCGVCVFYSLLNEPLASVIGFRSFIGNVSAVEREQKEELKLAEKVCVYVCVLAYAMLL
jgi:hypothetical protein